MSAPITLRAKLSFSPSIFSHLHCCLPIPMAFFLVVKWSLFVIKWSLFCSQMVSFLIFIVHSQRRHTDDTLVESDSTTTRKCGDISQRC
ncbi:hypothetical protein K438DRAFT_499865 [Mycena galopus ATCC 62051]|nr:hypothetical protein K438DRAFT_499865 [Mycena galopus ATCC 62051]